MKRRSIIVGLALLAACGTGGGTTVPTPPVTAPGLRTTSGDYTPPPGAYNPAVTESTIRSTICVSGWTATVRPSTSYTNGLKAKQMKARHLPGSPADYEEDHFVPLELGGAPADPSNLWPEPRTGAHASAGAKDRLENSLKVQVCNGSLTLATARQKIANQGAWTP